MSDCIDYNEWNNYYQSLIPFIDLKKDKPSNMMTPEQFNKKYPNGENINCLGFAIGQPDIIYLGDPDRGRISEFFTEETLKYGFRIKPVNTLDDLKGKTGFIVYGYFSVRTWFGINKKDFHVVRINPDGTLVHKPDNNNLPAAEVKPIDIRGRIEGYDEKNDNLIHLFELLEERNMDREAIKKSVSSVFERLNILLNMGIKMKKENEELMRIIKSLKGEGKQMNSNDINRSLQKIDSAIKQQQDIDLSR